MMVGRLLTALFLVPAIAFSQSGKIAFNPSKPLTQSSIDQWTSEDGLISNNLTSVTQASDGFLWVTTYNGLLRFDGLKFELFDRENTPFLQSDAFYRAYVNKDKIWFTTQGSGIVLFEKDQLKPFLPKSLPKSIRCLWISENGNIWAGSNNNGLFLIQDTVVTRLPQEGVKDISIMSLAEDVHHNIWVATNGGGVVKIKGDTQEKFTTENGLSGNVINTIRTTPDGDILVGTTKGFDIISQSGKITSVELLHDVQVNSMIVDDFGSIWLATERGLARINRKLGIQELYTKEEGFPTLELTSIAFDNEGSVWITTSKAGLIRMKDSGIMTFSEANGLALNLTNIVAESPDGRMYVGTDGGDIDILTGMKIERLQLQHSQKNISIRDICFDKNGVIWIGSYNGVLKKKGNQEILYNTTNGLPVQDVRRILEDKSGNLWFATRSGGIIKFRDNKVVAVFDKKNGLESNYVLSLELDAMGNIWAGTNGGGLSRIDSNHKITTYHIDNDDSGLLIFNIHIDASGMTWLITNIGLFQFNGKGFTKLEFEQAKGGSYFDWTEDDYGNVWVTTNKGILRLNKRDVLDFVSGKSRIIKARIYDNHDGMRNKECTGATRSLKSSKGQVWIPTIGGASVIFPDRLIENTISPPVYITRLATDEQVYKNDSTIRIQPGNLRYTFSFTGLSLIAPTKNQFRYKLENFDENWVDSEFQRQVDYTNLKPGKYTFRVIASNNDGIWNNEGASMSFEVLPFFYQRTIFFILAGIGVLLTFLLIYKWRIYEIEKRNLELKKVNSELDKFVYSASHDLRAPLASVLGLVNIARLDDGTDKLKYFNLIEKSIKKLDGFIGDIIDFSRNARLEIVSEEIHFEKIIHEVMDDLRYLDESNNILRMVTVNTHGLFFTDSRRLKVILSNLISNSIKYHTVKKENPFIEVKVESDSRRAQIRVSDNGSGISENHIDNIFKMFYRGNENTQGSGLGLYIVKETVEKIQGTIEVTSTFGKGSEFIITLPSLKV